jgi:hypothetical protein
MPRAAFCLLAAAACRAPSPPPGPSWRLVHHETFDAPLAEPAAWTEDLYGDDSPYHVDAYDEDGAFFAERGGDTFRAALSSFRSFRKSFPAGQDGWLTIELYGRDENKDGIPESGGRFLVERGQARLVSARHTDAAILRSTAPLPPRYRVEVTVSGIDFGGRGPTNGYDGDESGGPWRFTDASPAPRSAVRENGVYFLCITDYARPAPHNNVFIHHHRKVVMDTDNNTDVWSSVWNPVTRAAEPAGERYVSMIWLDGSQPGTAWTGNPFVSYTPGGWVRDAVFVDQYLPGERYVFAIERDGASYTLSVRGRFARGGERTYTATRRFTDAPPVWHYNQTPAEYRGDAGEAWPAGTAFPEHFFFGDPHINFYEGTAVFDDVKLYLPS